VGTDALQHRESIGRFYYLARTVKNSKRLENSAKQIKKGVHRKEVKVSDQYYGY
jgi:hypothetical protein